MTAVVGVLLGVVTLYLGITAHELGHVLGALATRMSVQRVQIGRGHQLAQFPLGKALVRLDVGWPSGVVNATPKGTRHLRLRMATFALAGPLVGLAFVAVLLPVRTTGVWVALLVLVGINVLSLLPIKATVRHPSGVAGTDGYTVLRALRGDPTLTLAALLTEGLSIASSSPEALTTYLDAATPDDPVAPYLRLLAPGADENDLERALSVAAAQDPPDRFLALVGGLSNPVVWDTLVQGRTPSTRAVEALGRAVEVQPGSTAIRDTFAWALAVTGHPGAGLKESNTTLADGTLSPTDRASCLLVNAICLAGVGELERAEHRRAEALELDPDCALLPIADRALDEAKERSAIGPYAALATEDDSVWELPPELQPVELPGNDWGEWFLHRLLPGVALLLAFVIVIALAVVVVTLAIDL